MSAMPRPVRGRPVEPEIFAELPPKPVGQKLKNLAKIHTAEQSFLLKIEEEEKLSRQQAEPLKAHYQKFDMMDSLVADGSSKLLSRYYRVNLTDGRGL
ncbi:Protein E7 [Bienertia sinuspersici]